MELLLALAALIITYPFVEKLTRGPLIESILMTIVLVSAVLAISERSRIVMVAAILALPPLVGRWIHHYRPDLLPPELFLIGGIVFILFVIVNLLRFILTAQAVDTEVLCGAISAYLLFGLLWTFGYWLAAEVNSGAFSFNASAAADKSMNGFNALYFSFVTLSTLGYGDITPATSFTRMLAATESNVGLLYVAVLIARLVSLYSSHAHYEN